MGVCTKCSGGIVIRNNKGFTLPELLLALLLVVMISAILTELMVFNTASTAAYSRFGRQQFTIHDAFTRLSRDIEEAVEITLAENTGGLDYKTITLKVDDSVRTWKIDGGTLYLDSVAVVEGLSDESRFTYSGNSKILTVVLKPEPTNKGRDAININKPIITQYSLVYKKVIDSLS